MGCCDKDAKGDLDQCRCACSETEEGFRIDVSTKDEAKKESFKALIKAVRDFCGCSCCR